MVKFLLLAAHYVVSKRPQTLERDAMLDYIDAILEIIGKGK